MRKIDQTYLRLVISVVIILSAIIMRAEDITLTTYYPAPYGIYNELRAKRTAVGPNWVDAANYPLPVTANLAVEGNMAIGLPIGNVALSVNGSASYPALLIGNLATVSHATGIAIGHYANAAQQGVALGYSANAAAYGATAVGFSSDATGMYSVAVGYTANAGDTNSIALGRAANAPARGAIALGRMPAALCENSVAIGLTANAGSPGAVAIGYEASAFTLYTIGESVAVGFRARSATAESLAMGTLANANGSASIAIGHASTASGIDPVAIGDSAVVSGDGVAIGYNTSSSGDYAVVAGYSSRGADNSVAIGDYALADTSNEGIAIGTSSVASGLRSIAIGDGATATGTGSIALGCDASVSGDYSMHINLGSGGPVTADNVLAFTGGKLSVGAGNAPVARLEAMNGGGLWTESPAMTIKTTSLTNLRTRLQFVAGSETSYQGWELGRDFELNGTNDMYFYHRGVTAYSPVFKSNGSVGIGINKTTTSATLDVDGTIYSTSTVTGNPCTNSSLKYKDRIEYLAPAQYKQILSTLDKTNVVTYRWKNSDTGDNDRREHIGVIAEEAPEEIVDETRTHINHSDYLGFLFAVVKAQQLEFESIKETLTAEVERQKVIINSLKEKLKNKN